MLYKLATMDRIILYSDTFPLSSNLSFNDFIQVLENENFSPYRLLVDQIPLTNNYHLEFEPPIFNPLLDRPVLADWKFLDKCVLKFSEDEKALVLKASISTGWLLFHLLFSGLFIALSIFVFIKTGLVISLLVIIFIVAFFAVLYRRDVRRFNKIRFLAMKNN